MRLMTFVEQINEHLRFLHQAGLAVENLIIDSEDFIRAPAAGESGRGEYAYKTTRRLLVNGTTGLMTWCRCSRGETRTHHTYGQAPSGQYQPSASLCGGSRQSEQMHLRLKRFWEFSSKNGGSDYLDGKRVGAYGVRFRKNQYGRVAVIPMIDAQGVLRNYQILNADGSKVYARGAKRKRLFHPLLPLEDGSPVGVAEGYATAATCLEITGIRTVVAFAADNLAQVGLILRQRYPRSAILFFADNDRHLIENKGVIAARRASERVGNNVGMLIPNFDGYLKTAGYSDWNDLARTIGLEKVLSQIQAGLRDIGGEQLARWIAEKSTAL